jgi:hypothetical protein
MSQRQIHDNTQKQLRALIMRGRAAIAILRERELLARTSRQVAADEERVAANKAAEEQKRARQAREQKRLEMVRSLLFVPWGMGTNNRLTYPP